MATLLYRIDARRPATRELDLELELSSEVLAAVGRDGSVELFLPTWTPGSYLVREFARHLGRVTATDGATGAALRCEKRSKNRVRVELPASRNDSSPSAAPVRVAWTVYAHELSVRTADLTGEHAYWNHACLLLWPVDARDLRATLTVRFPTGWDIACALPMQIEDGDAAAGCRTVRLLADDLDRAMDAPCLIGRLQRARWNVGAVGHALAIDGLAPVVLPPRLVPDLQAIVAQAAAVFGGDLPYPRYEFLCLFTAEGHGGLEHGDSTTLLMGRTHFASEKGYRDFLSLAAHELFHAWNGKRMRPVEFWRYDYEAENYTEFLWLIEGWTAYYDDLLCLRAGRFTRADYLEAAAGNVNGMLAAPGRFRSTLRESSFDAWIRLYRPDENTRNSSQNYYGNGAVAAMCLDLWIRRATSGERSLDDVVRGLYRESFARGRGYRLDDVHAVLREAAGDGAVAQLEALVGAALDPALDDLLGAFAIRVQRRDQGKAQLGVHFEAGGVVVASVTHGSPAFAAGLHPGDELLAIGGMRIDASRWSSVWQAVARVGQPVPVLFARRGLVLTCDVVPVAAPGTVALELMENPTPQQLRLRDGWLPAASAAPVVAADFAAV